MANYAGEKELKLKNSEDCPIVETIKLIGSQWNLIVIRMLFDGPKGFNMLLKSASGINPRSLSRSLKHLEDVGIISRTIISTRPVRVQYELTNKGESLRNALVDLKTWGEKWIDIHA